METHEAPPLRALAEELKQQMIDEKEIMQYDRTLLFWENIDSVLYYYLTNVIHIKGETGTGKSTVGMAIQLYIMRKKMELLKKGRYKDRIDNELSKVTRKIGFEEFEENMDQFIFSDQTEFGRFIKHMWALVCAEIDENSRYASTGYSASSEETGYAYYSDTFAQMLTDRILCSPATITDINSNVILEVMGTDLKSGTTKLKLSYRDTSDGSLIILGYVIIDVNEILEKEYYKRYRERKFRRMELLAKHGKRDVRELEFDYIAYRVFLMLKEDALVDKITVQEVEGVLDIVKREEGRIYSMLADNLIVRKAGTILGLYSAHNKARVKREIIYENGKEEKKTEAKLDALLKVIVSKQKRFVRLEEEMKKMSDLYKEWLRI